MNIREQSIEVMYYQLYRSAFDMNNLRKKHLKYVNMLIQLVSSAKVGKKSRISFQYLDEIK